MLETIEVAAEAGTTDDELRAAAALEMRDDDTQETGEVAAEPEQEAEPEEIEEIELSFGAKSLKVAKSAIPEAVRTELEEFTKNIQGDYTRKTQEIAEQRKALEGSQELVQKLTALRGDALKAFSTGQALADEIHQLEAINLRDLRQSNPDQARWISDEIALKRQDFQRQVDAVAQHEAAMGREEQQAIAKLLDAGKAEVTRTIKGFDEAQLIDHALTIGIPESEARRWALNPKVAVMAWESMQYRKLQASAKAATAPRAPSAPAAPMRAIASAGTGGPPDLARLADTDMAAYARERDKQERARKGR